MQSKMFSMRKMQGALPVRPCSHKPSPVSSSRQQKDRSRCSVIMNAETDYYELLGVGRSADKKEIKQAYRQKARKFHPVSLAQTLGCCGEGWTVPQGAANTKLPPSTAAARGSIFHAAICLYSQEDRTNAPSLLSVLLACLPYYVANP